MQDDEVLQFAGEVDVEEVFITSSQNPSNVDLTNFMVEFNLYEDLFSPTMHGDIVISDSNNLITELPMIGTELITVKFRTPTLLDVPENIIEKTFQVYSITNRTLNNDRSQFYALNFMSDYHLIINKFFMIWIYRKMKQKIFSKLMINFFN